MTIFALVSLIWSSISTEPLVPVVTRNAQKLLPRVDYWLAIAIWGVASLVLVGLAVYVIVMEWRRKHGARPEAEAEEQLESLGALTSRVYVIRQLLLRQCDRAEPLYESIRDYGLSPPSSRVECNEWFSDTEAILRQGLGEHEIDVIQRILVDNNGFLNTWGAMAIFREVVDYLRDRVKHVGEHDVNPTFNPKDWDVTSQVAPPS